MCSWPCPTTRPQLLAMFRPGGSADFQGSDGRATGTLPEGWQPDPQLTCAGARLNAVEPSSPKPQPVSSGVEGLYRAQARAVAARSDARARAMAAKLDRDAARLAGAETLAAHAGALSAQTQVTLAKARATAAKARAVTAEAEAAAALTCAPPVEARATAVQFPKNAKTAMDAFDSGDQGASITPSHAAVSEGFSQTWPHCWANENKALGPSRPAKGASTGFTSKIEQATRRTAPVVGMHGSSLHRPATVRLDAPVQPSTDIAGMHGSSLYWPASVRPNAPVRPGTSREEPMAFRPGPPALPPLNFGSVNAAHPADNLPRLDEILARSFPSGLGSPGSIASGSNAYGFCAPYSSADDPFLPVAPFAATASYGASMPYGSNQGEGAPSIWSGHSQAWDPIYGIHHGRMAPSEDPALYGETPVQQSQGPSPHHGSFSAALWPHHTPTWPPWAADSSASLSLNLRVGTPSDAARYRLFRDHGIAAQSPAPGSPCGPSEAQELQCKPQLPQQPPSQPPAATGLATENNLAPSADASHSKQALSAADNCAGKLAEATVLGQEVEQKLLDTVTMFSDYSQLVEAQLKDEGSGNVYQRESMSVGILNSGLLSVLEKMEAIQREIKGGAQKVEEVRTHLLQVPTDKQEYNIGFRMGSFELEKAKAALEDAKEAAQKEVRELQAALSTQADEHAREIAIMKRESANDIASAVEAALRGVRNWGSPSVGKSAPAYSCAPWIPTAESFLPPLPLPDPVPGILASPFAASTGGSATDLVSQLEQQLGLGPKALGVQAAAKPQSSAFGCSDGHAVMPESETGNCKGANVTPVKKKESAAGILEGVSARDLRGALLQPLALEPFAAVAKEKKLASGDLKDVSLVKLAGALPQPPPPKANAPAAKGKELASGVFKGVSVEDLATALSDPHSKNPFASGSQGCNLQRTCKPGGRIDWNNLLATTTADPTTIGSVEIQGAQAIFKVAEPCSNVDEEILEDDIDKISDPEEVSDEEDLDAFLPNGNNKIECHSISTGAEGLPGRAVPAASQATPTASMEEAGSKEEADFMLEEAAEAPPVNAELLSFKALVENSIKENGYDSCDSSGTESWERV